MKRVQAFVVAALVAGLFCVGYGQAPQGAGGGQQPPPRPEGRPPGGPPGGPGGGMPPDMRAKFEQLRNIEQGLQQAEKSALDASPELQAMRQEVQDALDQVIEKASALEQKLDDAVVKASPESDQLVKEKRQVLAELEDQAGPMKSRFMLFRLQRLLGGPGPGPGGRGPQPGGPQGPPPGGPAPAPAQPK